MKAHFGMATALMIAAQPALASDLLGSAELGPLITGNTLYVTMPAGAPGAPDGGIAPIYYGTDGSASAQLPAGMKLVGTWEMAEDGYCIDWENGPKNSCSTLVRTSESFVIIDQATGDPRGQVFTIATGNPEEL